jgi:hypothetical protein
VVVWEADDRVLVVVLVLVDVVGVELVDVVVGDSVLVPVAVSMPVVCAAAVVVELVELLEVVCWLPQPVRAVRSAAVAKTHVRIRESTNAKGGVLGGRLLKALARFAHKGHGFGEDGGHDGPQLLGLLIGRALDVDPVDRCHRQIDGELDRVVGPGQLLGALHLLGELSEPALQIVRVTEQSSEAAAFHVLDGSSPLAAGRCDGARGLSGSGRRGFKSSKATTIGRPMSPDDQLLYETRVRNRQVGLAVAAGALLLIASVVQLGGVHTKVDELTLDLLVANKRFPLDLIASVLNALASLAIAATLVFLYRAAKARNDDVKSFIKIIAMVAGGLAAFTGVLYAVIVAIKVHQFATTGAQTYDEANHLTGGAGLLGLQLLGQLAALLMAVSFVLIALQAMRVGLLTRFMGYLGMFAGALVLFQITQIPVVQSFWLLAVAYLISGRWPTGLPAAWRTGRAEKLQSSAEIRAQRAAGVDGNARGRSAPGPTPTPAPAAETAGATSATRTRSTTPKRKRKRRS